MMAVDVKRAYFYAPARREIYFEIKMEDWQPGDEANVAKLTRSLYGTRDAAQNSTEECTRQLVKPGFVTGAATRCTFVREARELCVTVNGNDFTVVCPGGLAAVATDKLARDL